ncbi:4-coumarate--CoA ligase 1-like isoform X1 [Photinus pyralis]|nr:4-coumarate--CoA ligase 1-like isoform X1 [Photinus pyralis]
MDLNPEQNVIKTPKLNFTPYAKGLGWLYFECLRNNRDKIAQIEGHTGQRDTFGQLLDRCIRVTLAMRAMGLKPGDIVSLCTFNHLDSCVPQIASLFLGAVVSGVDPTLTSNEIAFLLRQVMPKVIFVQEDCVEKVEGVLEAIGSKATIVVFGGHSRHLSFSDLLEGHSRVEDFKPRTAENLHETVFIFFSSGTTGHPKGICHNHYSLMHHTSKKGSEQEPSALIVAFASPYWSVFILNLHYSIVEGVTRLVYPRYDPDNAWQMFDYPLTFAFLNVTQMLIMLDQGRPENVRTDSLAAIIIGGDAPPKEKLLAMRAMFPNALVWQSYGQTEIMTAITYFNPTNPKHLRFIGEKPSSVGCAVPGMWYKIADIETGKVLGPDTPGELRVKTEFQTSGYHNTDSSGIWDDDGWLKTGDLAYYDQDLCFYIVGRVKEMFKFREWHIVPTVLEEILTSHPAIAGAAVIGVPHEMDSHHPMAVVVLKPSGEKTSEVEIQQFLERRVNDRQRLRGGVKFVSQLPLTPTGKINRKQVREMFVGLCQ